MSGDRAILHRVEASNAYLQLTIETGSEPIAGSVRLPGEEPRRFSGWIELAAVIEHARAEQCSSQPREQTS